MNQHSQIDFPSEVTPANFSYLIEGLADGESLTVKRVNGKLQFAIKATHSHTKSLNNRLSFSLNPEPVHQTWMAYTEQPSDRMKKLSREHRAEINKKVRSSGSKKEMLRASILLELCDKDLSEAVIVQRSLSSYYQFTLGPFIVLTKADKTPVSVQEENKGEVIYL